VKNSAPVVAAALLTVAIAVAGCDSAKSAAVEPTSTAVTSTIDTAQPIAFYAAQYEAIAVPGLAEEAALESLPDSDSTAERQVLATRLVTVENTANAALLHATWPPKIEPDIRALVTATGPLLVDLGDLAAHKATVVSDLATAKAAANVAHADLGLPPLS
jgi:hypothetical protein